MRLIMQTNGGKKFARSMIESSKMSLLMKNSSNEKLNDITDDCKDLPGVVLEKCQILAYHWYLQTEEQRRRLRFQLQKNWFRLAISLLVVVAQFYWFSSYYIHFGDPSQPQAQSQSSSSSDTFVVDSTHSEIVPSSLFEIDQYGQRLLRNSEQFRPHTQQQQQQLHLVNNKSYQQLSSNDCYLWNEHLHNQKNLPVHAPIYANLHRQHNQSSSRGRAQSDSNSLLNFLINVFWKVFLTIKLICMMVFFEILRMSDTFWKVLFNYGDDDEDESKNRTTKKSPVDVGYIERNRGYK